MPARATFWAFLVATVLLLAGCAQPAGLAEPLPRLAHGQYTDKQLYRDITAEVVRGTGYYQAAAELQRHHRYPLKPGITVRLPTLTLAASAVGWGGLQVLAFVILAGATLAWFLALRGTASWPERLAAAGLVAASGAMLTGDPMILHERWAGLFLGLALALRIGWREQWLWTLAAVAAALAVRELALPFVLLALAFALWERRWREALGWGALIGLFVGFLALHVDLVAAHVRPSDLSTQGWSAFGGPQTLIAAIVHTSWLQYVAAPLAVVLALLPLAGWLGLPKRDAAFCFLLFAGYALMIALFARPDNFYWGAVVQPAWFVGLALLPRAAVRLARKLRAKRGRAANLAGSDAPL